VSFDPTTQPRVRRNDWGPVQVPELGAWEPTLSCSVVIPAYRAEKLLPYVLAGLAAQSYPSHLLEVVVADDGADPPLVLPEVRPENTKIARVERSWGRANACHTGALAADGDVIHWLDSDMLAFRQHVEAQLRWHHVLDHAVVLGYKRFVEPATIFDQSPADVRDQVAADNAEALFAGLAHDPHDWVEEWYDRTDDLRTAGPRALRTHVGATASIRRSLYDASGGMDVRLKLGEDTDLGYRLGEAGGVFIPERASRSWHLGASHVMTRGGEVNRYNDPFLANRVPEVRSKRRAVGRMYDVPYAEAVLDVSSLPYDDVVVLVDLVLQSQVPDLIVTLVGPWSTLDDARRSPLDDPHLDLRLTAEMYRAEARVQLVEALDPGRSPAMFRITLPGAAYGPRPKALGGQLFEMERTHHGLRLVELPDGTSVRFERTAAVERAKLVERPGEDRDALLDQLFGAWTIGAGEGGFIPLADSDQKWIVGVGGAAVEPDREKSAKSGGRIETRVETPAPKQGLFTRRPKGG
jgi:glycosyltransferase involved in cell wall biosynthesis